MGLRGPKPKRKEVIWSPELAYAVGLLVTDGCLSKDERHIDLTSKDREQLENFMFCIQRNLYIGKKTNGDPNFVAYRVQFSDVTLYKFLLSIGLTSNKSKTIGKVEVPDIYFSDFLRGHYDGDGCFYSYFDPRWKRSFMFYMTFLSASQTHILWLQEKIYEFAGIKGHISTAKNSCLYHLRYAKKETALLLDFMYPNPAVLSLSRKRLKIEQALGIVGLRLPN